MKFHDLLVGDASSTNWKCRLTRHVPEDASWNMFLESGQVSELQVTTKGIFIGITAAGSATGGVFSCGENLLRMILERKGELRDVGRWRTVLPVFA